MGRVLVEVEVRNPLDKRKVLRFKALVDTGASHLVLPRAWKRKLGKFDLTNDVTVVSATAGFFDAEVCGPVSVRVEGFRSISTEVLFVEMVPKNEAGEFEPLLGYTVLEQCQAAVDMVGHRLVKVAALDLK